MLKNIYTGFATLIIVLVLSSCSGKPAESSAESNKSHNPGRNCMNCHREGGRGKGLFTVAGSVISLENNAAAKNCTIKLYDEPNQSGKLVATLISDQKGNFYTTQRIDFSQGLFPVIITPTGKVKSMPVRSFTGQCNSCHGETRPKIWVD